MNLTAMDYVRAAMANAMAEGMNMRDLWECAHHAETPERLDYAVNLLAQTRKEKENDR